MTPDQTASNATASPLSSTEKENMSIYQIIESIRETSSKLEKVRILGNHKDNDLLRGFLKAVYDPRINYYITKLPKVSQKVYDGERHLNEDDVADVVERIGGREVTGKAAKELLAAKLASLNVEGKELLGYIIGRDVKAGMAESTILSVWPDLFYIPPYQRASSMDEKGLEHFAGQWAFYVQTKSDGQFCYAINRPPTCGVRRQAMSRAGSLYPEWLARKITAGVPYGHVAMGELLVYRNDQMLDRKTGNGILNSVLSSDGSKFNAQTDDVQFVAWDMVTEGEFDAGKSEREYRDRWLKLLECTGITAIDCWVVGSVAQANAKQTEHTAMGLEGTVWKTFDMGWRDCSSGDKNMMKAKTVFDFDAEIVGAYVHKKNPDMLGGFDMASSDRLVKFSVGSGFSQQQRLDWWAQLRDDPHAFDGRIAACEGNAIETSKSKTTESVFLPIFVEIRSDKMGADSRARFWEQFEAAKLGKRLAK